MGPGRKSARSALAPTNPPPGPPPPWGRREGLVQVVMHDVDADRSRAQDAREGVHVRAVAIDQAACSMHGAGDLLDVAVEEAEGVRVGDHEARDLGAGRSVQGGLERRHVDSALCVGRNGLGREAGHRAGRRVRAVGGVGYEDDLARGVGPRLMIGAYDQDARELALGACRRLKAPRREAADLAQPHLQRVDQLEGALIEFLARERVDVPPAGKRGRLLVDLGVVLHRAGAEGVELRIYGEILLREAREVTHEGELVELRKVQAGAGKARRDGCRRHVAVGQRGAYATGGG